MMRMLKLWLMLMLISCGVWAAPIGEITHLSGMLSVKRVDGTSKVLSVKSQVFEGDLVTTETDTYARLKFIDGGEIVLRPNSQLKVDNYRFEENKPESDNILVSMLKGGLRAVTGMVGKRNKEKVAYQTPTATIGIRGTHFGALLCQGSQPSGNCADVSTVSGLPPVDGLHVDVASGAISLTNAAGTVEFTAGQFAHVPSATQLPVLVPPERGIRVTMPSSIAVNKGSGAGIGQSSASDCAVK